MSTPASPDTKSALASTSANRSPEVQAALDWLMPSAEWYKLDEDRKTKVGAIIKCSGSEAGRILRAEVLRLEGRVAALEASLLRYAAAIDKIYNFNESARTATAMCFGIWHDEVARELLATESALKGAQGK